MFTGASPTDARFSETSRRSLQALKRAMVFRSREVLSGLIGNLCEMA